MTSTATMIERLAGCIGTGDLSAWEEGFVRSLVDGWAVVIAFQASFYPTGTEVARLAEYLADDVRLMLEPADGELDLGAAA